MSNKIVSAAIHHLNKDSTGVYHVSIGNGDLTVSSTANRLIDDLHRLYSRRPSKAYGRFSDDKANFPTSVRISEYLNKQETFQDTTIALMYTLAKEAGSRTASEGGHVFFAHFIRDDKQFILVAIVNDKISAALTSNADLEDVKHLDIDGFRFAGRIDLTGWINKEDRYVSFIKGKGNVSDYFKSFLGCDSTIERRIETTSLVQALKHFSDLAHTQPEDRASFMAKALEICSRDAKADKMVNFESLANELLPEEPEKLLEVLTDPDRRLSDGFVADRRALKGLVEFKAKTRNWSVEFERKSLHDGTVHFDADKNALTLYDVPEHLRQELTEEIGGD